MLPGAMCLGRHPRQRRSDERHIEAVGRLLRNEELRFPRRHTARAVHGGADVDERRWAFRIPAVLVGARPLNAHWPPNCFRQQRGVRRRILVSVATIAA